MELYTFIEFFVVQIGYKTFFTYSAFILNGNENKKEKKCKKFLKIYIDILTFG